jgi:serine/threonine-protein kinase
MGAVYLAEHRSIGRKVAVKVLLPQASANAELVRRFFHEAKATTEIRSPHIVDILDFGQLDDGTSYLVMEWLEGRTLASALRSDGPFAPMRAARIVRQIAKALAAAHTRGIVHRDLKPDNVFLVATDDDPEHVKVLDFGIAKLTTIDGQTQAGALLGTPYYMSPEQCEGRPVDARADVYSLGVIAYELLVGRPPFSGRTLGELILGHLQTPPPSLRAAVPSLPDGVEAAVT